MAQLTLGYGKNIYLLLVTKVDIFVHKDEWLLHAKVNDLVEPKSIILAASIRHFDVLYIQATFVYVNQCAHCMVAQMVPNI